MYRFMIARANEVYCFDFFWCHTTELERCRILNDSYPTKKRSVISPFSQLPMNLSIRRYPALEHICRRFKKEYYLLLPRC